MAINGLLKMARTRGQCPPSPPKSGLTGYGDETGFDAPWKILLSLGMIPPLSGLFTGANDNEAFALAA